jgi:hypothetical protein
MPTRVTDLSSAAPEFIRRKSLTAHNDGSMRTVVDTGEFGTVVLDEPVGHGGQGQGSSPLQTVVGALCGCEAVTFCRTAKELGLTYDSLDFEASYTINVCGRMGDRSVRPHFQKVVVRAVVACSTCSGTPTWTCTWSGSGTPADPSRHALCLMPPLAAGVHGDLRRRP